MFEHIALAFEYGSLSELKSIIILMNNKYYSSNKPYYYFSYNYLKRKYNHSAAKV